MVTDRYSRRNCGPSHTSRSCLTRPAECSAPCTQNCHLTNMTWDLIRKFHKGSHNMHSLDNYYSFTMCLALATHQEYHDEWMCRNLGWITVSNEVKKMDLFKCTPSSLSIRAMLLSHLRVQAISAWPFHVPPEDRMIDMLYNAVAVFLFFCDLIDNSSCPQITGRKMNYRLFIPNPHPKHPPNAGSLPRQLSFGLEGERAQSKLI